ncbi:MAG: chemotaxis protein CheD [Hyphomicrobiales bacterium]|nr:chemotaxis protein CheD [Hyphomicrobiales bacterium]
MTFASNNRINVTQCSHVVSADADVVLFSVLGSCVAACAFDEGMQIGGMNHILLPGSGHNNLADQSTMFGTNLMELLLNDLYKKGARKSHLKFKLFGGAQMFESGFDAGSRNIDFLQDFLANEGLDVVATSLGGKSGRQIEFHPTSGRSRQRFLSEQPVETTKLSVPATEKVASGELELF